MAQGLQTFNDYDDSPTTDITDSLCRVLGSVYLTEAKGSIVCDAQRVWIATFDKAIASSFPVKITVEGNVISWEYLEDVTYGSNTKNFTRSWRLVYGSY